MGRKRINETGQKRQRGSQAYTMCGFDDRIARPEFSHIGVDSFNRALDKWLRENEPGYDQLRSQQYGRTMRGLGKKKKSSGKGSVSSEQGKKSSLRWWEGGEA